MDDHNEPMAVSGKIIHRQQIVTNNHAGVYDGEYKLSNKWDGIANEQKRYYQLMMKGEPAASQRMLD